MPIMIDRTWESGAAGPEPKQEAHGLEHAIPQASLAGLSPSALTKATGGLGRSITAQCARPVPSIASPPFGWIFLSPGSEQP